MPPKPPDKGLSSPGVKLQRGLKVKNVQFQSKGPSLPLSEDRIKAINESLDELSEERVITENEESSKMEH